MLKKKGLVYCSGCNTLVGTHEGVEQEEIITFFNVREVLFRPHTSYTTHFDTNDRNTHQVIFTEIVEHGEKCFTDDLDVANVFLFPIVDLSVEAIVNTDQPSSSKNSVDSVIRVAAFSSESLINFDENYVVKCQ